MATYNADSIQILSSMEGLRRKAEMYIGTTDSDGIFQLLKEAVDNGLDEVFAGRNNLIQIVLGANKFIVADNSTGIPVGIREISDDRGTYSVNTLTAIFTTLHAGGKFGDHAYKVSAGTHGVGAKTITALSTRLDVWTNRSGQWYHQAFSKGNILTGVEKVTAPEILAVLPVKQVKGTVLMWETDSSIFGDSKIDSQKVLTYAEEITLLNKGLTVCVKRGKNVDTFLNKVGIQQYLNKLQEKSVDLVYKPCIYECPQFSVAFQPYNGTDDKVIGFTNSCRNVNGGTHVDGFWAALQDSLKEFALKKHVFFLRDLRQGCAGLINWKISEPKFHGQIKEKLVSNVKASVKEAVQPVLTAFFTKNRTVAKFLLDRATEINQNKSDTKQLASLVTSRRKTQLIPGILEQSTEEKDPEKIELFIVEGGSAGGTAKYARDKKFQEILKLKGKPINCARATLVKSVASEPVSHIMTAIGFEPKTKKLNLRVGKILLLADADPDGEHITILVLTMLHTYLPQLFEQNRVYVVDSPLYMAKRKTETFFADSLTEIRKVCPGGTYTRIKGWGEINAEDLTTIAFDKTKRKLFLIKPVQGTDLALFKRIVGDDVSTRKSILGIG